MKLFSRLVTFCIKLYKQETYVFFLIFGHFVGFISLRNAYKMAIQLLFRKGISKIKFIFKTFRPDPSVPSSIITLFVRCYKESLIYRKIIKSVAGVYILPKYLKTSHPLLKTFPYRKGNSQKSGKNSSDRE